MTITTTNDRVSPPYAGDGATVVFPITFQFFAAADLKVILTDANDNETTQVLTTNYSVTGGAGATGSLTMVVAPATGETLNIIRDQPAVQALDLIQLEKFPAASLEAGFDKTALLVQQAVELIKRAIQAADSTDLSAFSMKLPVTLTASKFLQINGAGTGFTLGDGPVADTSALVVVSSSAPAHQVGLIWIDTSVANEQIWKQSDGTDFITMFTVNTDTNDITITIAAGAIGTDELADLGVTAGKLVAALVATGKYSFYVPAAYIKATTTAGCGELTQAETSVNKVPYEYLPFDSSTDESGWFQLPLPKGWNAGTVSFRYRHSHPVTATNFGTSFGLKAVALSDGDATDTAFGSEVIVSDTGGTTEDFYTSPESAAITIGNTPAKEDEIIFVVTRKLADAGDTMAVDAHLRGVEIFFTRDTANDA